jgi:serine/threonine-protein kinase
MPDLHLPLPIEAALLKTLAKLPQDRWRDAKEMREGLQAALRKSAEPDEADGRASSPRGERRANEVLLAPPRVVSDRAVGVGGNAGARLVSTALGASGLLVREVRSGAGDLTELGAIVLASEPAEDGLQLARELAARPGSPPLLFCGPEGDLKLMAAAIGSGVHDYVPLPLDPVDLSRKVSRALRWRR